MNRKIKRAAALLASAVLCLSMGMSVFAAESVTDDEAFGTGTVVEDKEITQIWYGDGEGKDGNKVTVWGEKVSAEVEELLKDEAAVKDILKDAGYEVTDDHSVVVLGAGDFKTIDMYGKPYDQDLSDGAEMSFFLGSGETWTSDGVTYTYGSDNWDDLKDLKDGDTIYVLHQTADGTWEVLEGKAVVEGDGYRRVSVTVTMTGFSPVAFIKVMSNGEVVVLDKNEVPTQKVEPTDAKTTTVTVKKSPKTGE